MTLSRPALTPALATVTYMYLSFSSFPSQAFLKLKRFIGRKLLILTVNEYLLIDILRSDMLRESRVTEMY